MVDNFRVQLHSLAWRFSSSSSSDYRLTSFVCTSSTTSTVSPHGKHLVPRCVPPVCPHELTLATAFPCSPLPSSSRSPTQTRAQAQMQHPHLTCQSSAPPALRTMACSVGPFHLAFPLTSAVGANDRRAELRIASIFIILVGIRRTLLWTELTRGDRLRRWREHCFQSSRAG
jgi:hypothetical protein